MNSSMGALCVAAVLLLGFDSHADEAENPADARMIVSAGPFEEPPYEQEMILLTIRGYYGVPITRETLEQPEFPGFAWTQLGRDRWFDGEYQGRQLRGYERTMALFPRRAGTYEIPSFTHHLDLMKNGRDRFTFDLQSPPITIEVQPRPQSEDWWLPASALQIGEKWDRRPDQLEFGQAAERSVTLSAAGAMPEMLPPMPDLSTPGIHVFPHPEERFYNLTPEGPISTVVWRWTVTLLRPEAAVLKALEIPWFDTSERKHKTAALPAYRVALAAEGDAGKQHWLVQWTIRHVGALGLVAGLGVGLTVLLWNRRLLGWVELKSKLGATPTKLLLRQLRRCARAGDAAAMRNTAYALLRQLDDPADRTIVTNAVRALDRHLFGGDERHAGPPDLMPIVSQISRVSR